MGGCMKMFRRGVEMLKKVAAFFQETVEFYEKLAQMNVFYHLI